MSSATKSSSIARSVDPFGVIASVLRGVVGAVQAVAFWTAALLPLLILGGIVSGAAGQHPEVFVGALSVNLVTAVLGHNHSPS